LTAGQELEQRLNYIAHALRMGQAERFVNISRFARFGNNCRRMIG